MPLLSYYSILSGGKIISIISGGGNGVTFSPTNSGANITLHNGNITATDTVNSTNRAMSYLTSTITNLQKVYLEFTVNIAGSTVGSPYIPPIIGVSDNITLNNTAYPGGFSNGFGIEGGNGGQFSGTVSEPSGNPTITMANGDVIGLAINGVTGNIWLSKNGTYVLSGNPATATSPSFNFSPPPSNYYPCVGLISDGTNAGNISLNSILIYTPPSGFVSLTAATPVIAFDGAHTNIQGILTSSESVFAMQSVGGYINSFINYGASSGKRYIEFKILCTNSVTCAVGASTSRNLTTQIGNVANGFAVYNAGSGIGQTGLTNDNNAPSYTTNDVAMIAVDFSLGYAWYGKNGTWLTNTGGVGNPVSGTNPSFNGANLQSGTWYPGATVSAGTSTPIVQVYAPASSWNYTRPTGFLGWDGS